MENVQGASLGNHTRMLVLDCRVGLVQLYYPKVFSAILEGLGVMGPATHAYIHLTFCLGTSVCFNF